MIFFVAPRIDQCAIDSSKSPLEWSILGISFDDVGNLSIREVDVGVIEWMGAEKTEDAMKGFGNRILTALESFRGLAGSCTVDDQSQEYCNLLLASDVFAVPKASFPQVTDQRQEDLPSHAHRLIKAFGVPYGLL